MTTKKNVDKSSNPSSRRQTERLETYVSDGIRGRVTLEKDTFPVSLIDITPFGVGVVPDTDLSRRINNALVPGAMVQFQYTSRNTSSTKLNAIVAHLTTRTIQGEKRLTFGLAFLSSENSASTSFRRKTERFACSEFFRPHALCASPYFFGERAFFSLTDISSSGCSAITSARNKFLSPNMEVSLTIVFPLIGTVTVDATVRSVTLHSKGSRYRVSLEFKEATPLMLQSIGEYLILVNPSIPPEELRRAGLRLSRLTNVISVTTPMSREDWDTILALRQKLSANGEPSASIESLFDQFDSFARNLIVKIGERAIATGRVIFINSDLKRSESISQFGLHWPESTEKTGTLEVSFPMVDPNFNSSESVEALVKRYLKIAFENDAQSLICAAPASDQTTLEKYGFQPSGAPHKTMYRGAQTLLHLYTLELSPLKMGAPTGKMSETTFRSIVLPILEQIGASSGVCL
jgi:hypothetical protein